MICIRKCSCMCVYVCTDARAFSRLSSAILFPTFFGELWISFLAIISSKISNTNRITATEESGAESDQQSRDESFGRETSDNDLLLLVLAHHTFLPCKQKENKRTALPTTRSPFRNLLDACMFFFFFRVWRVCTMNFCTYFFIYPSPGRTMPVVDEEKGGRVKWKQPPLESAEFMDVMKRRRSCPLPPRRNCQLINKNGYPRRAFLFAFDVSLID